MTTNMDNFQRIDKKTATDIQVLAIKGVEIHALGMGYTGPGNRPDNTARIEITGMPKKGTVTRFIILFYPVGDTRLVNPFYNADRTTLTVTQTLAALPGWISVLTAIPANEGTTVSYSATPDSYEFECLRILTSK
jgi:hypothetical protein